MIQGQQSHDNLESRDYSETCDSSVLQSIVDGIEEVVFESCVESEENVGNEEQEEKREEEEFGENWWTSHEMMGRRR